MSYIDRNKIDFRIPTFMGGALPVSLLRRSVMN